MKNIVLLLTGTINTGSMILTNLTDPEIRRSHYLDSLKFYLEETNLQIVFVENSGTDVSSFFSGKYLERLEFLTFNGNDVKNRGKGFGELHSLRYAINNSKLLSTADFVLKITGRLKILNIEKFIRFYAQNNSIYILADLQKMLKFADSRMFGFHPEFLEKYLLERQDELDDISGKVFESILAKAIHHSIIDEKAFEQLRHFPEIVGISGSTNKSYKSSSLYFWAKQVQFWLKSYLMKRSTMGQLKIR